MGWNLGSGGGSRGVTLTGRRGCYDSGMTDVATIRCPMCGVESPGEMPGDACVYFWECPACQAVVRPRPGDCCVFCSYGSARCPPSRNR